MNKKDIGEIIDIVGLVIKVGAPAIKSIIDVWQDDVEITPEMIDAVLNNMHDPDDLFKED